MKDTQSSQRLARQGDALETLLQASLLLDLEVSLRGKIFKLGAVLGNRAVAGGRSDSMA